MNIVLWDTRKNDVQKDFAGGMGVGVPPGTGGPRGKVIRYMYLRDNRPPAMNFAYVGAILKELGHKVSYELEKTPVADVYIFNPSLLTLKHELEVIEEINRVMPHTKILVMGQVAFAIPEAFSHLKVSVLRGEPEQLKYMFDDVMQSQEQVIDVGSVANLDDLPKPDWSLFDSRKFKIKYDFWRFPTALIQQSRCCTFKCNYCPYIIVESKTRFRDPKAVVDEIRYGMKQYGFKSFKFRDPLFGLNHKKTLAVAEGIKKLNSKVQFSIETRIDLMKDETLVALRNAGLTSITFGIETPNEETLKRYHRIAIKDDRQRDFVVRCRELGVRTVAGFMIGFPEDTEQSIYSVLNYARKVNPTFANFNIVTPYPGTPFYDQVRGQIEDFDFSNYSVYQPVMQYKNLTSEQLVDLHAKCFEKYYFRSRYFVENGKLLWPQFSGRARQVSHRRAA